MNDEQKKAMAIDVAALCEGFNRKPPTEATFRAYEIGLDGLSVEQLNAAFGRALQQVRGFMSSPTELRELAGEVWEAVLRALPLGPYRHIDCDDPLVNATIRHLGGWPSLLERAGARPEAEKWDHHECPKTFDALCRAGVNGDSRRPLPGNAEVSVVNGELVPAIPQWVARTATTTGFYEATVSATFTFTVPAVRVPLPAKDPAMKFVGADDVRRQFAKYS